MFCVDFLFRQMNAQLIKESAVKLNDGNAIVVTMNLLNVILNAHLLLENKKCYGVLVFV